MNPFRSPTRTSGDGDQLIQLVARANPVTDDAINEAGLAAGFDALLQRLMERPTERPRRSRRRGGVVALVIALGIVLSSGVALGGMYSTHTGFFPPKKGTENDTSEYLRTDAPDFPPLVRSLVQDIPFPPGDSALSRVPGYIALKQPGADGVPEVVQAAGIKGQFSFWALCAWRGYWVKAYNGSDRTEQATGADGLATIASSDAMKAVDAWWPVYLDVAHREAAGDPSVPAKMKNFFQVNCAGTPNVQAGR
jgi:hypothetical protein